MHSNSTQMKWIVLKQYIIVLLQHIHNFLMNLMSLSAFVIVRAWKSVEQPLGRMRWPVKIQAHWSPHFVLESDKEWKIEKVWDLIHSPLSSHPLTAVIQKRRKRREREKGLIFALDLTMGYPLPENPLYSLDVAVKNNEFLTLAFSYMKSLNTILEPMKPDLEPIL